MEESEKDLQDQVEEITTTSFQISGCKIKTFKRFIKYCEDNAMVTKVFWNNIRAPNGAMVKKRVLKSEMNYSIALDRLLDCFEADAKTSMLYERIVALESKVSSLQNVPTETKNEPKTFGFMAAERNKKNEVNESESTK